MNFGKKITILYLSFVALIVTMVTLCFGQKVELVSADYYAQELQFQDRINAINNAKALPKSIEHTVNGKTITLTLDSALMNADLKGTVTFFRPSDSSKDVKMKLNFVDGMQVISNSEFIHGAYKLQLNWESNNQHYFKEEVIFIN